VSRLEKSVTEGSSGYDHHISVYVEGIGTRNKGSDSLTGRALGTMWTGVKDKVDKGIRAAVTAIMKRLQRKSVRIDQLTLDTFGFSRGAAAARYCLHRAFHDEDGGWLGNDWYGLPTALGRLGFPVGRFGIKAVGLYDTVSSYGLNHHNDVAELKLDAIRAADAVLHLAAANEYRENFALTSIDSAGGSGREVFLPGAHSDIGGGYVDLANENATLKLGDATPDVAKFLVHGGWFKSDEAKYTRLEHVEIGGQTRKVGKAVWLRRGGISNRYSYIPLHLMADFANQHGLQVKLAKEFAPPSDLQPLHEQLKANVVSGEASEIGDWANSDEAGRSLRRRYLHVSFSENIGMGVRLLAKLDGTFVPEREIIRG
jgi:hypothetical protein